MRAASPARGLREWPPSSASALSQTVSQSSPTGMLSPRSCYEGHCVIPQNRAPDSLWDKKLHWNGALESTVPYAQAPSGGVCALVWAGPQPGPQPSPQPTPRIPAGPGESWDTAGNRSVQPPCVLEGFLLTYRVN